MFNEIISQSVGSFEAAQKTMTNCIKTQPTKGRPRKKKGE
jgi:hypothetical protein